RAERVAADAGAVAPADGAAAAGDARPDAAAVRAARPGWTDWPGGAAGLRAGRDGLLATANHRRAAPEHGRDPRHAAAGPPRGAAAGQDAGADRAGARRVGR